jgi:flagellar basal-body rod protein FlgB
MDAVVWVWRRYCNEESMPLDRIGLELGSFLSYLTRRQEVIASNIANSDTPGYRTLDVAVPSAFSSLLHQAAMPEAAPGLVARNDGNNVSIDREARLLSENTLKFSLATQLLRGEIRNIRSAIEEGRSS